MRQREACSSAHVDVSGQFLRISSLLLSPGARDKIQIFSLGSSCLYPLSNLIGPAYTLFNINHSYCVREYHTLGLEGAV